MNKFAWLFLLAVAATPLAFSQAFQVKEYRQQQLGIQQKAMYTLGGWAAVNIISGAAYAGSTNGSTPYFHRMNMYWGIVNGALATASLFQFKKAKQKDLGFAATYQEQQKVEKLFLFNAGLDLAYITAGIAFKESSKSNPAKRDKRFGYGNSLLLQGGFLLLFDGVMYSILHHKGKVLDKVLDKVNFSFSGQAAGMLVKLD